MVATNFSTLTDGFQFLSLFDQAFAKCLGGGANNNLLDVFLVIGDSDAVGMGNSAQSPNVQAGTALVYVGSSKTVIAANDPVPSSLPAGSSANTGSQWPAFGNSYYTATGRNVAFVTTGVGGSTQTAAADFGTGNWDTAGALFPAAIAAFNVALPAFVLAGYITNFKGVIVSLGSNDANAINASTITVGQYTSAATTMHARIRSTFSNPELPIYYIKVGANLSASDTGYAQVRTAQVSFAAPTGTDPYTFLSFINTLDFLARGMLNSGAHYTQAGYNEVGAVLASNILTSQIEISFQRNNALNLYWSQGNVAIGSPVADALLTINPNVLPTGTSTSTITPPLPPVTGSIVHVLGPSGFGLQETYDAYGGGNIWNFRAIGGTVASPVAVAAGQSIFTLSANTYTGATFPTVVPAYFRFIATELQSPTTLGNRAEIATTLNTTTTRSPVMGWENDGGITVPPSVTGGSQGAGTINAGTAVLVSGQGGVGYKSGAGGTTVQTTSKVTAVTLNNISGQITMNNAALSAAAIVSFAMTNTSIAASDIMVLNHVSAGTPGAYTLNAQCASGGATINVRNNTAGTLSEAIVLGYVVIKGAIS